MWELDYKESWAPKNWCFWTVVLEKTLESPLDCKEIQPVRPKGDQSWVFIGRTDAEAEFPILLATWCKEPTHWKRPWCWERVKTGGEGDDRGWDGWMASLTRWMWVWVNSKSWWWTGRPGVLRFIGSQRVGHDWATELNWTEPTKSVIICYAYVLSRFSHVQLFASLWTVACQAPLSMGFPRIFFSNSKAPILQCSAFFMVQLSHSVSEYLFRSISGFGGMRRILFLFTISPWNS